MFSLKKNPRLLYALIAASFALSAGAAEKPSVPAAPVVATAAPAPVVEENVAEVAQEKAKEAAPKPPVMALDSEEQKRAYASGVGLAHYIENQITEQKDLHITLNKDILIAGMMDAFNHQQKMDDSEVQQTLEVFDEQVKILKAAESDKRLVQNKTYVANFSQREGVKKSQKGFYYLVEEKGEGNGISDNSMVAVQYKGTLIDGTVVDEPSVQNSNQILRVKDMMPAMRDTIKLLRKGGKLQIVIPPTLVESTVKLPHPVAANSTLLYTLEVNDIN